MPAQRRDDDDPIDTRSIHFSEQLLLAERLGTVRPHTRDPRALRRVRSSDMYW